MAIELGRVQNLVELAKGARPIRLAVIGAGQGLVLEGVQQAKSLGLAESCLVGDGQQIARLMQKFGWDRSTATIVEVRNDFEAASMGVRLVREGRVDAIMKGQIHTETLMRALLDERSGLRVPGRRASHVLVVDVVLSEVVVHHRCGSEHCARPQRQGSDSSKCGVRRARHRSGEGQSRGSLGRRDGESGHCVDA